MTSIQFIASPTPGPWTLGPMHRDGDTYLCLIYGPERTAIAEAYSKADGRLMAAAEELLEALRLAERRLSILGRYFGPSVQGGECERTAERARAAIAKATERTA